MDKSNEAYTSAFKVNDLVNKDVKRIQSRDMPELIITLNKLNYLRTIQTHVQSNIDMILSQVKN